MNNRDIEDLSKTDTSSTKSQTYFNLLKSNLGIGIIVLPYVTYQVGWLWSILLYLPISFSCLKATMLIIEVADNLDVKTCLYADIISVTMGSKWATITDIAIVVQLIGLCIAYLIFLSESVMVSAIQFGISLLKWESLLITLIIIFPLSLVKQIHFFNYTSQYGFYAAVLSFLIVFYDCQNQIAFGNYNLSNLANFNQTFKYVGVAILCCEGVFTILPIRDSTSNKTEFKKVATQSMLTAFFITITFSVVSSSTYQDHINQIVIFSLQSQLLIFFAVTLYTFSLLLTFPLQLFPAFQILEMMIAKTKTLPIKRTYLSNSTNQSESRVNQVDEIQIIDPSMFVDSKQQILLRTCMMIFVYIIAYYIPNISHYLNLIGSIFGSLLQFCFPVIIHLIYFKNSKTSLPIFVYSLILFVACLAIVLGTAESLAQIF